ncbi:cytosolic beta-glucosidase-like [Passerculus sandwichensis]
MPRVYGRCNCKPHHCSKEWLMNPEIQPETVLEDIAFPVEFAWGAATAAYQIEEGWNADGKGPNVWDIFTHQGGDGVFKNQTGDVACGSYTLWEEDLKCIKQLGLTHYCFSLSWSRLLPDGTTGFINQKGVNSYCKTIMDLGNGILLPVSVWFALILKKQRIKINIHDTYNNPIIYITENGFLQSDPALLDASQRWEYFRLILQKNLK